MIVDKILDIVKFNYMSQIYTRFAPEPSSQSCHIGHVKCMLFGFNKHDGGRCYLRFDDTNPETESQINVDGITEDVKWLGFEIYRTTYTSDYFETLIKFADELILNNLAYVEEIRPEDMKQANGGVSLMSKMRHQGIESKYRSMPIEWQINAFNHMKKGYYDEGTAVLRLKIDMQHVNHSLRDPIAYRVKYTPHYRTGQTWCVYPTYDYSHGIVDALEGITHSYCTMEYYVRREQYYWPVHQLIKLGHKLVPAEVTEFGKLIVKNNILSKRNINKLVKDGLVTTYDDPRLLTIKGLRRRGYTASILKKIVSQAPMERHESEFSEPIFEYHLRKELNETCLRMFAVVEPLELNINITEPIKCAHVNHPKKTELGTHQTLLTSKIYIERNDFKEVDEKNYYRLAPGKVIRLRYGPFIKYVSHNDKQIVCETTQPDKPNAIKGIIHWVSDEDSIPCIFEFYQNILDENGQFNTNSKKTYRGRVEKSVMSDLAQSYQFERLGYFKFDRYENDMPVFTRIIDLFDQYNGR